MSDAEQMWITAAPPFGPDEAGVLIAIDAAADDPGQRLVAALLDRGHEGEEGVFYLLPDDLRARCERNGGRLAVRLLAWPEVIDQEAERTAELRAAAAALSRTDLVDGRVTLLRREIETDFLADTGPGEKQGVLLIGHANAGPATPADLFAAFDQGDAGFAVVNAD